MADPVHKSTDPVLKVVPQAQATTRRAASAFGVFRQYRRMILLVALPLLVALGALTVYFMGGRYISTDNAYIGAQKVLITPDISGKISKVLIREGQHVKAGDELFEIDAEPFKLALAQAQAKLASAEAQYNTTKGDFAVLNTLTTLSQKNVELKQRDVERKSALVESRTGSQADLDTSAVGLVTAQLQNQLAVQRRVDALAQLMGDPNLPMEKFPAYAQAKAVLDQAQRDLDHTVLRAPISGTATQVDNIQLGRFVTAGSPVLSVIDDAAPWVDANPKETDITYLQIGQKAELYVDTFPGHPFRGTVIAVSPGTGAQFAILPPQNATGNWVKVVQRVPVRIAFDRDQDLSKLRAGMSVVVDIDTRRRRTLASLFGAALAIAEPGK